MAARDRFAETGDEFDSNGQSAEAGPKTRFEVYRYNALIVLLIAVPSISLMLILVINRKMKKIHRDENHRLKEAYHEREPFFMAGLEVARHGLGMFPASSIP